MSNSIERRAKEFAPPRGGNGVVPLSGPVGFLIDRGGSAYVLLEYVNIIA
jgi:hypothetical protein